jgi:hypothetical protein
MDFTRRPAHRKMHRILVSPSRRASDGKWSARRIVWASFYLESAANLYAEMLRKDNPDWIIERPKGRR